MEAEEWFLARQGFDAEALAHRCQTESTCDPLVIVDARVDWIAGRDTWSHVEETHLGLPQAIARIERRCTRPGQALRGTCEECEHLPKRMLAYSDLSPARPGAICPWDGCQGCVHSYVGDLEEMDRSLVAAYAPARTVRELVRYIARQILATDRRRR